MTDLKQVIKDLKLSNNNHEVIKALASSLTYQDIRDITDKFYAREKSKFDEYPVGSLVEVEGVIYAVAQIDVSYKEGESLAILVKYEDKGMTDEIKMSTIVHDPHNMKPINADFFKNKINPIVEKYQVSKKQVLTSNQRYWAERNYKNQLASIVAECPHWYIQNNNEYKCEHCGLIVRGGNNRLVSGVKIYD